MYWISNNSINGLYAVQYRYIGLGKGTENVIVKPPSVATTMTDDLANHNLSLLRWNSNVTGGRVTIVT